MALALDILVDHRFDPADFTMIHGQQQIAVFRQYGTYRFVRAGGKAKVLLESNSRRVALETNRDS
jgi:hypothetical protein